MQRVTKGYVRGVSLDLALTISTTNIEERNTARGCCHQLIASWQNPKTKEKKEKQNKPHYHHQSRKLAIHSSHG